MSEWLTDKEKRLLFSALTREKKVCAEVDKESCREPYEESLVSVVESLEHKFYYDRLFKQMEKQGRADAIDEFAKPVINGTLHTICRMIASGDIPTGVYQKWLSHTKIGFMTPLEIYAEIFKEQLKSQK